MALNNFTVRNLTGRNPENPNEDGQTVIFFVNEAAFGQDVEQGSLVFFFGQDAQGNRHVMDVHYVAMDMMGFQIPNGPGIGQNAYLNFQNAWDGGDNTRQAFTFTFNLAPPQPAAPAPAPPPAGPGGGGGGAPAPNPGGAARRQRGGRPRRSRRVPKKRSKRSRRRAH
jgi:hypothetical protein